MHCIDVFLHRNMTCSTCSLGSINHCACGHLDVQQGVVAIEDQVALLVVQDQRHLLAEPAYTPMVRSVHGRITFDSAPT
jgi:hypothetical protein